MEYRSYDSYWERAKKDFPKILIILAFATLILVFVFDPLMKQSKAGLALTLYDEEMNEIESVVVPLANYSRVIQLFYAKNTGVLKSKLNPVYQPKRENVTFDIDMYAMVKNDTMIQTDVLEAGQTMWCKASFDSLYVGN